jgi:hypothetical protein
MLPLFDLKTLVVMHSAGVSFSDLVVGLRRGNEMVLGPKCSACILFVHLGNDGASGNVFLG